MGVTELGSGNGGAGLRLLLVRGYIRVSSSDPAKLARSTSKADRVNPRVELLLLVGDSRGSRAQAEALAAADVDESV